MPSPCRVAAPFLLVFAGCSSETPTTAPQQLADGWHAQTDGGLSPEQVEKTTRGRNALDALGKALKSELVAAIDAQGAAAAIMVCKERAPALTAAVAAEHHVRLGRIGVRTRNPANQAPSWAEAGKPPFGITTLAAGPDGALGMVVPIPMQPLCVQCHGPTDQLGAGVAAALQQHYANDRATGFAVDELRGWFWIEVP